MKTSNKKSGFSVLEVLVGSAMMVGVGVAMSQMITTQARNQRSMHSKAAFETQIDLVRAYSRHSEVPQWLLPAGTHLDKPMTCDLPEGATTAPVNCYTTVGGINALPFTPTSAAPGVINTLISTAPPAAANYDFKIAAIALTQMTYSARTQTTSAGTPYTENLVVGTLMVNAEKAASLQRGGAIGGNVMSSSVKVLFCTDATDNVQDCMPQCVAGKVLDVASAACVASGGGGPTPPGGTTTTIPVGAGGATTDTPTGPATPLVSNPNPTTPTVPKNPIGDPGVKPIVDPQPPTVVVVNPIVDPPSKPPVVPQPPTKKRTPVCKPGQMGCVGICQVGVLSPCNPGWYNKPGNPPTNPKNPISGIGSGIGSGTGSGTGGKIGNKPIAGGKTATKPGSALWGSSTALVAGTKRFR